MHSLLKDCLICPRCQATAEEGLQPALLKCARCQTAFFNLQGLNCFFPSGDAQKVRWQDLLAQLIEQGQRMEQQQLRDLAHAAHAGSTRERLTRLHCARSQAYDAIIDLLHSAGLQPQRDLTASPHLPPVLAGYIERILHDWGGPSSAGQDDLFTDGNNHNQQTLQAVLDALPKPLAATRRLLVLGAGAGRLSWDLHCALKPQLTLAQESDPLLAYLSKHLIADGATLTLAETEAHPHQNLPFFHSHNVQAPRAADHLLQQLEATAPAPRVVPLDWWREGWAELPAHRKHQACQQVVVPRLRLQAGKRRS